jgi:hypothetical protein
MPVHGLCLDGRAKKQKWSLRFESEYAQKVQFESKLNIQPIVNSAPFNFASRGVTFP